MEVGQLCNNTLLGELIVYFPDSVKEFRGYRVLVVSTVTLIHPIVLHLRFQFDTTYMGETLPRLEAEFRSSQFYSGIV